MPKLKGLLDSANAKLAGLLGDFPQGFNAGAVAGFPGWAGDMAYLADTARLALTGADSQAAPEDYVGTTDYIAKQAGYPVPQTLSGQLGAAVGGLMSPGPGDLAKFAPVLSAIPFFHGSPHKYDAVDLSKIGTGEGAQAYGHGYYGADAQNTAEAYAANVKDDKTITDLNAELSRLAKIMNDDEAGGYRKYRSNAGREAAAQYDALMARRESVVSDPGNLYRGEYRWPDPAKEAATPLTGDDLLDWDRPLSEQSPSVQERLAVLDHDMWGKDGGDYDPTELGQSIYHRLQNQQRDYAITAGKNQATTLGATQDAASKDLLDVGIPGIRYLDQMSRGAGDGTRNYVMFDDKGIKLLERNGEPIKAAEDFAARRAGKAKPYKEAMGMDQASRMARAREMGFDTPAVHWSRHGVDVNELDSGKFAVAPFNAVGTHVGTKEAAKKRFETVSPAGGGGASYPLLIKTKKPYLDPDGKPWDEEALDNHLREIGGYNVDSPDYKALNEKLREKIFAEYDSIPYRNDVEDAGSISYIVPPNSIRSVNAKFDKTKRDSANLLAGGAAAAVGLGAMREYNREKEYQ